MSKFDLTKIENKFTSDDALGRVAIAVAAHPFDYVKILIQLGYEPLPAYPIKTIFGRQRLALPGVFQYLGYIRRSDGFFGLYKGLTYKLTSTLLNGFVHVNTTELLKQLYAEEEKEKEDKKDKEEERPEEGITEKKLRKLIKSLLIETGSRFIALTISYPFHMMTIRMFAQFVGREHNYDSLTGGISDIVKNGGVLALYGGFIPKFLGDCVILWLGSSIIFVINCYVNPDPTVKGYIAASVNFIVSSFAYPFQLVSTVMSCNGPSAASLTASHLEPTYIDWVDCWKQLSELGQIKRGSSLIWRYQVNPSYRKPFVYKPYKEREFKHW